MKSVLFSWAAGTDIGGREENEDAYAGEARRDPLTGTVRGVFIVCDGMGGHADGAAASELAIHVLRQELRWALRTDWPDESGLPHRLRDAVVAANRAIFEMNTRAGRSGKERAGTTVALLLIANSDACVVHVGDSRVYQVTATNTVLLTEDHNIRNREIRRGEPPEVVWQRPDARYLTQALGPLSEEHIEPEIRLVRIEEPSLFLLCSDGLYDHDFVEKHEVELRRLLEPTADLEHGCQNLLATASRVNGHDNVTAVLVNVHISK